MTLEKAPHEPPSSRANDRYDPQIVERHWQAVWSRTRIYETAIQDAERPFYNLMMFPYPSAEGLHVGNLYAYTGADIHGRFQAMRGYQVFEPMGFDAFGIHSENFAIKQRIHPRLLTAENVARFRETQLKAPAAASTGATRSSRPIPGTTAGPSGSSCNSSRLD